MENAFPHFKDEIKNERAMACFYLLKSVTILLPMTILPHLTVPYLVSSYIIT